MNTEATASAESLEPKVDVAIAYRLSGKTLDGGWLVGDLLWPGHEGTGGLASAQYVVTRGAERAFLKAMDFAHAYRDPNPNAAIAHAMKAFAFELDVLRLCSSKSRIVHIIGDGRFYPIPGEIAYYVPYLLFELADKDVRQYLDENDPEAAWCLTAAHQITVGIAQLHRVALFHQDLKGSNALWFSRVGCKIGDLGSACSTGHDHNKDDSEYIGTSNYAPPERCYDTMVDDRTRQAGDLFLLGSLIVFMFTKVTMHTLLLQLHLPLAQRPRPFGKWTGPYETALPYLQHAFGLALDDFHSHLPVLEDRRYDYRPELIELVRNLCNPDYRLRGFLLPDGTRTLQLERAISKLRLLAVRIEARKPLQA